MYRKTIVAAIAWAGTLCAYLSDLSLSQDELGALAVGAIGVYSVYKIRNKVV